MPMGLSYVAGVLEHKGYEIQLLDLLVSKYSKEKVRRKMSDFQPDVICITSVTMNYPVASEILKYCRSLDQNVVTVIGGPHVTFSAVDTLENSPWIDIVVRGEGEETILDIVGGKSTENVDGIAYRVDGRVVLTRERALIEDLDALPLPARHLFPLARYHSLDVHASLITGRGCPFNCIFCVGSKMGGRRARYRNPELIVDEIEHALSYGFKEVNLEDDLVTLNHRHMYGICDEITARGLKFNWSAFSRADTVNPELLRRMKEAGCTWLLYGVESGNQGILDTIKKKTTLEKIKQGVKMAKDAGIDIFASFVIGLPGETQDTLQESVKYASELGTFYGFHVLSPFPGTEIREKAGEYGIEILTDDWSKYDCNRPITRTEGAGPEELTAVLHEYYQALKLPIPERDTEKLNKAKMRSLLAGALLKGDVIEGLGTIEASPDPVVTLAGKITDILPYSLQQVTEALGKWVGEGILKFDRKGDRLVWMWS
ncbi:MAG: radical SAM protein [Dehalococcoidia bacterium]|nr:radical SAM protein [Dehalococcoidia bacterium]